MRHTAGSAHVAAFCFALALGVMPVLVVALAYRSGSGNFIQVPVEKTAAPASATLDAKMTVYLVRPEAPETGVNVVSHLHQRPPATDAEGAEWLSSGEMVTVEPGTVAMITQGEAPGYAVCIEVLNGPQAGLRGWVWQDTLRDEKP